VAEAIAHRLLHERLEVSVSVALRAQHRNDEIALRDVLLVGA
jgi:hypothetical protein